MTSERTEEVYNVSVLADDGRSRNHTFHQTRWKATTLNRAFANLLMLALFGGSTCAAQVGTECCGSRAHRFARERPVVYRTAYRSNGDKYAVVKTEMVYLPRNVAKPARLTLTFAPRKSSATISGNRVAIGFEDYIAFDASAGQTVTLTLLKHDAHFGSFALLRDGLRLLAPSKGIYP